MDNINNYIFAARRLNNSVRRHLYVNVYQAKHIPAKGKDALSLFDKLAEKLREETVSEKLLIIGFAETATAIGARIAEKAAGSGFFATTTREYDPKGDYIEFSESHSHAKRQLLNTRGLDEAIDNTDRIVFAEDEITTGKTIEKLINKLKERYTGKNLKFAIASILNSLSEERAKALNKTGVKCVYLHKIKPNLLADTLDNCDFSRAVNAPRKSGSLPPEAKINYIGVPYIDQRIVSPSEEYSKAARAFAEEALRSIELSGSEKNILVLGTEEFMYPAILAAQILNGEYPDKSVLTHSATRSPIEVCANNNYPLFNRTAVPSLYEKGRQNFLYNLKPYDRVFVFTDAKPKGGTFDEFAASLGKTEANRAEFFVWGEKD